MILHLMQKIEVADLEKINKPMRIVAGPDEEESWESVREFFVPDSCHYVVSTYNGWMASKAQDGLCNDLLSSTAFFTSHIRDCERSLALDEYAAIVFYRDVVLGVCDFPNTVIKIERWTQ